MRGSIAVPAEKIDGHISTGTDKNVRRVLPLNAARITFRDLAKLAWPHKTESALAHVSGADPRTCRRWLACGNEPPADVLGAVLCEIMKRYQRR